MKKIFIGLLLILCGLDLFRVNYLPTFVGYILIFLGLDEEYECPSLSGSRTICVASAILMAVVWGAGLLGYGLTLPVGATLQLLCTYRVVVWAEQQGEELGWEAGQLRPFRVAWYALAGTVIAAVVLSRLSFGLGLVWTAASVAAAVYYICVYYKLWKSAVPAEEDKP